VICSGDSEERRAALFEWRRSTETPLRGGVDHERLNYFYQGRRFRLTDAFGKVVEDLIA